MLFVSTLVHFRLSVYIYIAFVTAVDSMQFDEVDFFLLMLCCMSRFYNDCLSLFQYMSFLLLSKNDLFKSLCVFDIFVFDLIFLA